MCDAHRGGLLLRTSERSARSGGVDGGHGSDTFSLESDHFLNIICDAFCKVFPTVSYVPRQKDVFCQGSGTGGAGHTAGERGGRPDDGREYIGLDE